MAGETRQGRRRWLDTLMTAGRRTALSASLALLPAMYSCGSDPARPDIPPNFAPSCVVQSGPSRVFVGDSATYVAVASDPDGDAVTVTSWNPAPLSVSGTSATYRWDVPGDVSIQCSARDARGASGTGAPYSVAVVRADTVELFVEDFHTGAPNDDPRFTLRAGEQTLIVLAPSSGRIVARVESGAKELTLTRGGLTRQVVVYLPDTTLYMNPNVLTVPLPAGNVSARLRVYDRPDVLEKMREGFGNEPAFPLEKVRLYLGQGSCDGGTCSDLSKPPGQLITPEQLAMYEMFRDSTNAALYDPLVERPGLQMDWGVVDSVSVLDIAREWSVSQGTYFVLPKEGYAIIVQQANNQEVSDPNFLSNLPANPKMLWAWMGIRITKDGARSMANESRIFGQLTDGTSYCGARSVGSCPGGNDPVYSDMEKEFLMFVSAYLSHARDSPVRPSILP